jgi:hypothetical protein
MVPATQSEFAALLLNAAALPSTSYPNVPRSLGQAQETAPNALRTVRRVPPSAFPNLPPAVRKHVEAQGRFVYSRGIRPVNEAQLRGYADPPPAGLMKHQGIEDAFTGKASTVVYCVDGKWKEIAAAD